MDVEMIHLLPPHTAVIDNDPEAIIETLSAGDRPDHAKEVPHQITVLRTDIIEIGHMQLGDEQDMDWRARVDVVKRKDVVIFMNLARGYLAAHDPTEDAIVYSVRHGKDSWVG
jgi:hypothetical protein